MTGNAPFGTGQNYLNDEQHLQWLKDHRSQLLDFYQPNLVMPGAGLAWIDSDGTPLPAKGAQLWLGARMLHVFALAALEGRPGADQVVQHALNFYLGGAGQDTEFGGWYPAVGGEEAADAKELYGTAHVILGASSALIAGFEGARELLDIALRTVDDYFWDEEIGRGRESFNREFTQTDDYRGQNSNMHLAEAYLAAYMALGDRKYLDRAVGIARYITVDADSPNPNAPWRLNEHFSSNWEPLPDYNIDDKTHAFRPYGSQVGHWMEWSKLLMQMRGLGTQDPWVLETAAELFKNGVKEGWDESGGFYYTIDWSGDPVVAAKYFWAPAEAIGAADLLFKETGDQYYLDWYQKLWEYVNDHMISPQGSWYHELDSNNEPITQTWQGRPDLYHAYQATLYAQTPADQSLASALAKSRTF